MNKNQAANQSEPNFRDTQREANARDKQAHSGLIECLALYTKLNKKPFSKDALTSGLPIQDNRITPSIFVRAAERAGLIASFKKRKLTKISNLVLPCILTLKNNQACILEYIDTEEDVATIIFSDAQEGKMSIPIKKLNEEYLGYAVYLTEDLNQQSRKENLVALDEGHWFWKSLWDNKSIYRDVIIASIVINIFVLANPLFVMNVYDRVVPNNAIESLWVLAIGVSVVYLFDVFLKFLRAYFLEIAGKKSDIIMSSKLFEQTLSMSMSERTERVGSFASNLKEFDSIRNFFTSGTVASVVDLPFSIIFLLVIFFLAGSIVLIPIIIIIIIWLYSLIMSGPIQRSIEESFNSSAQKNAVLIETLNSINTIKSMGMEAQSQWKWEQAVGEIAKSSLRSKMLQSSIGRMTGFMQQVSTVVIVLGGVYIIKAGDLTMGGLIAAVMLSQRAIGPMGQIANLTSSYQQTKTSLNNLNQLMKKEVERPKNKRFIHPPKFYGTIEFVNVTFTYPTDSKPALVDTSFRIDAGEKVGIIGRIGSGKSTIEKLILGLYKPDKGSILIDGIDITQLDPAELRRNINYVPQDITLFSGDVRENIAYRAPFVDDDVVLRAARIAGVDDFIKLNPAGYSLEVDEGGASLSGGQRQSIAVARAMLTEAPIYMFDEPTNAMDAKTEQALIDRIKLTLVKNTSIIVTHKMSLLQLVDRLIVMDQGKVVADGNKTTVLEALKTGRINR